HVMLCAIDLGGDDRGVAGLGVARVDRAFPDGPAGLLVEGDDGGVLAAGRDDEPIAVDEGRFAVVPTALDAAEVVDEVAVPEALAVIVDADEVAELAEDENAVAVDGGRAAEVAADRPHLGGPHGLAVAAT